jgi:hypothetical protein
LFLSDQGFDQTYSHISILILFQIQFLLCFILVHRSRAEDRSERKAGVAWTIDVERDERDPCAYNPLKDIHVYAYAMDIPIPQEPQEKDLVSNEFKAREISCESLRPLEGATESSFELSMNDCKDICFWMLFVLCFELCSCLSSFSRNVYQVFERAIIGRGSNMNRTHFEEFDEEEYVA